MIELAKTKITFLFKSFKKGNLMDNIKTISEFGNLIAVRERSEQGVRVSYFLYESPFTIDDRHIYSITLETYTANGEDSVSACDVSRDKQTAQELLDLLADGMVTSCTLCEILEDIL